MSISITYVRRFGGLLIIFLSIASYSQTKKTFKSKYDRDDLELTPPAPDYSQMKYWIAHHEVEDMADLVPGKGELKE